MKGLALFLIFGNLATPAVPARQDLLRRTGKAIESFWEQLSGVSCIETVQQIKFAPGGRIAYRQDGSFDYLVLLQLTGNDIIVDESRAPVGGTETRKNVPMLITNGFSTLAFIFHPVFQSSFEYSPPEPAELDGRPLFAVRFRHIAGARSPSVLKVRDREYPVPWQGVAWIDPATAAVVRISAAMMPGLEDLGVKAITADVTYAPVEFKDDPAAHWLPAAATVEVETARQHWRNVHSFANYRLFSVDVKTNTRVPQ